MAKGGRAATLSQRLQLGMSRCESSILISERLHAAKRCNIVMALVWIGEGEEALLVHLPCIGFGEKKLRRSEEGGRPLLMLIFQWYHVCMYK